jgi:hypothetical protein
MARRRKYRNQPVTVDGIRFDSKAEAARYGQLKLLLRAGRIRNLRTHVPFLLEVAGERIGTYEADFVYEQRVEPCWEQVVEDVKGVRTREYILKRNLMRALYGITIWEVQA